MSPIQLFRRYIAQHSGDRIVEPSGRKLSVKIPSEERPVARDITVALAKRPEPAKERESAA